MPTPVYLIDYLSGELTANTPLGGNIDTDRYAFCIIDAQNSKVKELLGDTLYDKIETDYVGDDLAGDYLTLYNEFIYWIIIHQSAYEYLNIGAIQIANGGIFEHTPQNGQAAESSKIKMAVDSQKMKAEMYIERMNRWLLRKMLPEYVWHYDNIVNPITTSNNFDFDII